MKNGQKAHISFADLSPFSSDIALIKLPSILQFTDYVKSIKLASAPTAIGADAITLGYGRVSEDIFPQNLQYTKFNTINKLECTTDEYKLIPDYRVACAKGTQSSICIGDVGGPLVSAGKLIGVAISTWKECEVDHPQGFTDILPYVEWIYGITFVFSH